MHNPGNYNPDQFGWHRKPEIPFQTSITRTGRMHSILSNVAASPRRC